MIYRQLGNTKIDVSTISLGCEGFIGKSAEETNKLIDFAISNGVNFIDLYSSNPEMRSNIGSALRGRRDNFVLQGHLCTTWENGQYLRTRDIKKTKEAFDDQMTRLATNYLDIGMIHYVDTEDDFDNVFHSEIIEYALQLKEEGKIRHIGMSSHNPKVALMAVETGLIEVLLFSINPCYDMQPSTVDIMELFDGATYKKSQHNIDTHRERLYELCESRGVGIDVMKAFGGGDLLSETNSPFGKALTAIQCMDYALSRPAVASVMVGCKSINELQESLNWCDATTTQRDYTSIITANDNFTWAGHCMYCGHCAPCSVGIEVAGVNKYLNLTVAQGEIPETVREHYKLLSHHASECIECGECETRCPFGVNIIDHMQRAVEKFGY